MSKKESTWVHVQELAFTQWMDETLKKRNMEVKDLRVDLCDGIKLINFFELLCGHQMTDRYDKVPTNRIQKINNLSLSLRFMERNCGVRSPGCSVEDIIDAEQKGIKLILGLLYVLYRKYRMRVDLGDGANPKKTREEDMLLEWVRTVLKNKGFTEEAEQVQSFRTSFNDGRVFLALTKCYDGENDSFDYAEECAKSPLERLTKAFEFAESDMSVNKLLDASEVAEGNMDERALALYTSLFYHAFKAKAEIEQMQETVGASAEQLELQKKNRDELIKMNCELNEQLASLRTELSTLQETDEQTHSDLVEARDRIAELESLLKQRDEEILELKKRVGELQDQQAAEVLKCQKMDEEMTTLRKQFDDTQQILEEESEKSKKLEKDLEEVQEKLKIQQAANEGGVRDLTDRLNEESAKAKDLEEKHTAAVEQNEQLQSEVKELRKRVKREQKKVEENEAEITEMQNQSRVNTSGLVVLRTNLDAHIADLHRWQKFLEGRAAEVEDPMEEIERLSEDLDKASFQEQLNILSAALQEESVAMGKILAERQKERDAIEGAMKKSSGKKHDKKKHDKKRRHRHEKSGEGEAEEGQAEEGEAEEGEAEEGEEAKDEEPESSTKDDEGEEEDH